jgi:hypothetical protein
MPSAEVPLMMPATIIAEVVGMQEAILQAAGGGSRARLILRQQSKLPSGNPPKVKFLG